MKPDKDLGLIYESINAPQPNSIPDDVFPYVYVGGGYFRKKDISKGEKADVLHGMQAVQYLYNKLTSK